MNPSINYCSQCGSKVAIDVPEGDNRPRHICNQCDTIHYQNPRVITGTLPIFEDKVLLCRRAIEPRHGYWTLPAGFMENGESTEQGALRETIEEAKANIAIESLYALYDLPHINQVYVFYRGQLTDLDFGPGSESLQVELFDQASIPWDQLAFSVVERTLRHYFSDREKGLYPIRSEIIERFKS